MNKPVQWKITSFLVGSSDENSAVFCQAKPFIGQEIFPVIQHMDSNVKTAQAELFEKASDMWDLKHQIWKKTFARILSKFLYFLPLFGEDFQFDYFQMGWNQQRIFLIERKLWVTADLKIVGVAMVLWDETHAWNCLFVVRLQMRTWNNASKRPGGATTI